MRLLSFGSGLFALVLSACGGMSASVTSPSTEPATTTTGAFTNGGNSFSSSAILGTMDAQDLKVFTAASERVTIKDSGFIGIGTTAPAGQLEVFNNASVPGVMITATNAGNGAPQLDFRKSQSTVGAEGMTTGRALFAINAHPHDGSGYSSTSNLNINGVATENYSSTAHGSKLEIATTPNGSTSRSVRVTIDHSGFVGIGTTTPAALLDVNGIQKMRKYSSQPQACTSTIDGAIAMANNGGAYVLCACRGGSTAWYLMDGTNTACPW